MKALPNYLIPFLTLATALFAQAVPSILSHQGRVAVDGVNFDGLGGFKFALVDGGTMVTPEVRRATVSVQVDNGALVGITVTDGGAGYVDTPAVTIIDDTGTGGTATASISGGAVVSVTVVSPGSNYSTKVAVIVADPPPSPTTTIYQTYWSNDWTSTEGSEPTAAVSLPVSKGIYSVLLGDTGISNMKEISPTVFVNDDVRLRIWFDDRASGFQQLTPDRRITAVGYAMVAGGVEDGSIHANHIAPGAVTASKLSNDAVTAATIADGAVTAATIAEGAVEAVHIAAGAVGPGQLAKALMSGSIPSSSLHMDFGAADFEVQFTPAFDSVPVVTLAANSGSTFIEAPGLWITDRGQSSFSGHLVLEPPERDVVSSSVNEQLPTATGLYASLAEVAGKPAIVYSELYRIMYARHDGSFWRITDVASAGGNLIEKPSIQVLPGGRPAIAYYNRTAGSLMYVLANDTTGNSWGTPVVVVATANDVGDAPSLQVVNGRPAISYNDRTAGFLKFVRAANSTGSSWGTPVSVAPGSTRGTSLKVVNGNPAIAFTTYPPTAGYVRASDAVGNTWGIVFSLDAPSGATGISLAIVDGNPAISYQSASSTLIYRRAIDPDGTSWASRQNIDWSGQVGRSASLSVIGGNPAVAYFDETHGALKYVRATDTIGATWANPVWVVRSEYPAGRYCSLSEIGGQPAIAYQAHENLTLEYIRQNVTEPPFEIQWIALEP